MSMDPTVSLEDLERRRRRASSARKASQTPQPPPHLGESEAMAVINEIFNPSLKLPDSGGHYTLPEEMSADDDVAPHELDISKLAELKEVFALFDTDCDGLISKDDLRFTYTALGNEPNEQLLEQMMLEAKEPLDYEAFVRLMSRRTQELDPEDVLLEAWSKWDDHGTGKIEERKCLDSVEIFPYLREPVIENSTLPADTFCQHSKNRTATPIYSSGRLLGLRLRFQHPPTKLDNWKLNLTASYRFLKRENFKTEGRLVPHSYCDFYFFASLAGEVGSLGQGYFHSPRFPAHYPAHIKCAYKFIGRPDTRVEILFEELQLPPVLSGGCQLDALTIFDAESAHMNAVLDVLCTPCPTRRLVSSGPDMLLEFNASSNLTAKGFRGKYKFVSTGQGLALPPPAAPILEAASVASKQEKLQHQQSSLANSANSLQADAELSKPGRSFEKCQHTYDSRVNKSGTFESNQLFYSKNFGVANTGTRNILCRYDFEALPPERIQIRFHDFNIPTIHENSTDCQANDALHVMIEVRGRYETRELVCGAFLPKPLMSNGPQIHMQYFGKYPPEMTNNVQYYGFRAEYRFLTNFGIMSGVQQGEECTFVYNSSERISGLFHSPNFPGFYLENVVCNYYFYAGRDERVVVHFTYFDVEGIGACDHQTASDYVEFSNFMSTDRKYSKYCGKLQDFEMRSDGHFFRVTLHSNDRFVAIGFRALYTFEPIPTNNSNADLRGNASMQSYVSHAPSQQDFYNIIALILVAISFIKYNIYK